MADDALLSKIESYLLNDAETISSDMVAKEYLMMPPSPVSANLVNALLSKNPRFEQNSDGDWQLKELDSELLKTTSFLMVYVEHTSDNQLLSLSMVELNDDSITQLITLKNSEIQGNPVDEPNATTFVSLGEALAAFTRACQTTAIVFYSYHQQRVLQKYLMQYGLSLSDNSSVIRTYFRLANITFPGQQADIFTTANRFINETYEPVNAYEKCHLLAKLQQFIIEKLSENGTITVEALTQSEQETIYNTSWPKATFTVHDIMAQVETPGVYGFKNEAGEFIYVGKGNNLRRRMLSYFRESDESPQKLLQLRAEAATFITNSCGSDLEALLVEDRLIRKYQPLLNSKLSHNSDSAPTTIRPMIILLPSSEEGFVQSLWYGEKSSIILKKLPRYWDETTPIEKEDLEEFFFMPQQEEAASSEKVICSRNLSVKQSDYDRIEVSSCANSEELLQLMRIACESSDGSGTLFR